MLTGAVQNMSAVHVTVVNHITYADPVWFSSSLLAWDADYSTEEDYIGAQLLHNLERKTTHQKMKICFPFHVQSVPISFLPFL